MYPVLRLTKYEKLWNDYYTSGAKRGVILRRYPATVTLTGARTIIQQPHQIARRSRVFMLTWSGDVYAVNVRLFLNTGEQLTMGPTHLPTLSGHSPYSTRSVHPVLYGQGYPAYQPLAVPAGVSKPPAWSMIFEPQIILPGNQQLIAEYSLANPDAGFPPPTNSFVVKQVVHTWEFPGFEGGT